MSAPSPLDAFLAARRPGVDEALSRVLALPGAPSPLAEAMRYSALAGGKRVRPLLALAVYEAMGGEVPAPGEVLEAFAALELVHAYSLIHDDLPCMDDDTLRRGRPTCHVVHGEAMALLAGDALQTLAFELLATRPAGAAAVARRSDAVLVLARAAGPEGMAGGQALDLAETGHAGDGPLAVERLRRLHALKTGRLLAASARLGALLAGADSDACGRAETFGAALGLLFQIADDLLDVTADAARLGKTAGKDARQEKLTYPALFGLEGAVERRDAALADAVEAARALAPGADLLVEMARWAAARDR